MAERELPGSLALTAEWALGADNWKDGMDLNLFVLSVCGQLVVKSIVSSEPGSPTDGDIHIVTSTNQVAIRDEGVWKTIAAQEGWLAYSLENDTLYVQRDGNWEVFVGATATVPPGGIDGMVLTKTGPGDDAYTWEVPVPGIPGASVELRQSGGFIQWRQDDNDPTWANLVDLDDITGPPGDDGSGVPAGGTTGQILVKQSDTDGDVDWEDIPEVPGPQENMIIAVGDEVTAITAGTSKVTFRMPYGFTLTAVRGSLTVASSSGTVTVDINQNGSSILSTKLTIDASEKTSVTAAVAPVISDTTLDDDAEITIDIDGAGTGATGLKVTLIGSQ